MLSLLGARLFASSLEVHGRCIKKHTKTQHSYSISPLIKKCLDQMKEHTHFIE